MKPGHRPYVDALSKCENLSPIPNHRGENAGTEIPSGVGCKARLCSKGHGYACKQYEYADGYDAQVRAMCGLVEKRKDPHDQKGRGREFREETFQVRHVGQLQRGWRGSASCPEKQMAVN